MSVLYVLFWGLIPSFFCTTELDRYMLQGCSDTNPLLSLRRGAPSARIASHCFCLSLWFIVSGVAVNPVLTLALTCAAALWPHRCRCR